MNNSLRKQLLFWCFFLASNFLLAQWGPIRIEFDELGFPANNTNLVNDANPGPVVVGEYDVLVAGVVCASGNEYTSGQDGINDLRVTPTLVRGPGIGWNTTDGNYDTTSSGSLNQPST